MQSRRNPQQLRSKVRVESILEAARELIGTQGNDAISMRTIAAQAGIPISSIYQYFPDKNAILRMLMNLYLERLREMFKRDYESINTFQEALTALSHSVDQYFQFFIDEPEFVTIWAGVQANTTLRVLDARDSEENAHFFASQIIRFLDEKDWQEVSNICLFMVSMIGAVSRMALFVDEETRAMFIREVKFLIDLRMRDLQVADVSRLQ